MGDAPPLALDGVEKIDRRGLVVHRPATKPKGERPVEHPGGGAVRGGRGSAG